MNYQNKQIEDIFKRQIIEIKQMNVDVWQLH